MDDSQASTLVLGGRTVPEPWDRLRRYCGLAWSGGPPETWAFRYYDAVRTDGEPLSAVDVLATAALHPGLSRQDLSFFHEQRAEVTTWLEELPDDVPLWDASDSTLGRLHELAAWEQAPTLSLLTKVLHRKRPMLIPLIDRHVLDWYRPVTGERTAAASWPRLLIAMGADLVREDNRTVFQGMDRKLREELGWSVSNLRQLDIIVWMGGHS